MSENKTTVATAEKTSLAVENEKRELVNISKPLFVLFAEFLGYASPIIDWAEDICDGKAVPDFKKKIVALDAEYIFQEMQKEYTIDTIRKWYDDFYPIVLKDYEEKMKSALPF